MKLHVFFIVIFAMSINAGQPKTDSRFYLSNDDVNIYDGTWLHIKTPRGVSGKKARIALERLGELVAMDWCSRRSDQFVQFRTQKEAECVAKKGRLSVEGKRVTISSSIPADVKPRNIRISNVVVLTEDPPIYGHIQSADSEKVREFLTGDKDLINSRDGRGGTPLRRAAFEGSVKIVELLFEFGARVEDVDHSGWTPLHAAAYSGHAIVVERLIARGAKVNAVDNEGRTPLMLAAHQGHLGALCVLLRNGANTDIQARSGASALMLAANCSECLVVQELLNSGARTDLRNQKNRTVLQQMEKSQRQEVIDLLRRWERQSGQSNKPKVNTRRLYESNACDSGAADAGPSSFALETSHRPDAEEEDDEKFDFSPFDRLVSCVLFDSDDE